MRKLRYLLRILTISAAVTVASAQVGDGIGTGNTDLSPVPEPNSVILMGGALAGLAVVVRRRNQRKNASPDQQQ